MCMASNDFRRVGHTVAMVQPSVAKLTVLRRGRGKAPIKTAYRVEKVRRYSQVISSEEARSGMVCIEVGIEIPNATVMMIEGADRVGLAQLHQFRGRVGRDKHQSYCFLFSTSGNITSRLRALTKCENGFELAEKDMQIRGPGQFYGVRQSGLPDLIMDSLKDLNFVKSVRQEANNLLTKDQDLKNHPLLVEKLKEFKKNIHLE